MGSPTHSDDGASQPDAAAPPADLARLKKRLTDAEARAARLDEWFGLAFEDSPFAMAVISAAENRYVRVNKALEALFGRPRAEILDVDPFAFSVAISHPEDLLIDQQLFGELALGKRRNYQVEKRFLRPDGTCIWGRMHVSGAYGGEPQPDMPNGPLSFIVVQVIDLTGERALRATIERREQELRHAQRVDGIGRLAGGIAHDFNNLLTVIAGHAELLKDLVGDAGPTATLPVREVQDNLEAIVGAADRAASLTAQLLAHGRRETVLPRTFTLSEAVAAMQRLLVRVIGSNIETDQTLTATGSIHADQGQIGQVVMNLVLNARDAMPDGGRLTLSTRDIDADRLPEGLAAGDWVALAVGDTGHGMDAEVQARIFEPFFTTRADRPGTQGSGLGLATVQRIVAGLAGHITVESALGEGSVFTVYLPRVATPDAAVARLGGARGDAELGRSGAMAAGRGARVLVVEDEPTVRALVASVLAGSHFRVAAARNGEEALSYIDAASEPFDLIVTDLVMARVGGAALAKHLHARGGAPRMLFISGYSEVAPDELTPFGSLLPKPFTPTQLIAAVRRAIAIGVDRA